MTLSPFKKAVFTGFSTVALVLVIAVGVRLLELIAKEFGNNAAILSLAIVLGVAASISAYLIERVSKK